MRLIIRSVPGFHWIQLVTTRSRKIGHWWTAMGLVRIHAYGPLRIATLRTDSAERCQARRANSWTDNKGEGGTPPAEKNEPR